MSKILIYAEKPSQMRAYANALGGFVQKGEFYVKDNFVLTSAFGHLIDLKEDTAYRGEGRWDKSYLPLLPELKQYQYEPKRGDEGRQERLKKLGELFNDPDISMIYVATDPDREGELIFKYVYNYFKCKKPYKRIWVSSLEDEIIREAFRSPKYAQGDSFIENLSKSGYIRAITDWLIGMNATQAASLQFTNGEKLSMGRVQTTILKIICDRYIKNKSHEKTYTYKVLAKHTYNNVEYLSESPIFETKEQANNIFQNMLPRHTFLSYEKKTEKQSPPLLHVLDTLTVVANKLYKYTASEVLSSAQKLYEAKLISYPRTSDPYITEEGFERVKGFLSKLVSDFLGVSDFEFSQNPKSVDGSKITGSHDALIPTGQTKGIDTLAEQERRIYDLILYRCLESFSKEAIYEKGVYSFENKGTIFKTHTNKLLDIGWKKYTPNSRGANISEEEEEDKDKSFVLELPCKKGDSVHIDHKFTREIESKPPKLFTPGSLTDSLVNLGKFLQEQSPDVFDELQGQIDLKGLEIGTRGTRPDIIEKLVDNKYIVLEKNKYIPTEEGLTFYNAIKDLDVVNVAQTARLEYDLKQVSEGSLSVSQFYSNLKDYVTRIVQGIFSKDLKITMRKIYGICPSCKQGSIIEGKFAYGCNRWKEGCQFRINKEIAHKKISEKNVEDLLQKGKTSLIKGFKSKAGKDFEAFLVLNENNEIGFSFEDKPKKFKKPFKKKK
ncbi:DNA topoisomerase [Capnocytophaga gingivalis]|uniref:type IA DNA topoisomerase n=1 Tax=Capnocytophaga gingivalis TaxID=1017 RepID=UPI003C715D7B